MKKIIYAIVAIMTTLPATGAYSQIRDTKADLIVARVGDKIRQMKDYSVEFTVTAEGNSQFGIYIVSGDKFGMQTDGAKVVSDGKSRYEVNEADREVLIDIVDPDDRNFFSNPTKAFDFAPEMFTTRFTGEERVGGVDSEVVSLTPRDSGSSVKEIVLKVSKSTGLPVELIYRADGMSGDIKAHITKLVAESNIPSSTFSFDASKYKDFEIIDFR